MKTSTRWILYSLFRVGLFAAALVAMLLLGMVPWIAAIVATLVAFSISYIFFSEPRRELAADLAARRERPDTDIDSDIENAALDGALSDGSDRTRLAVNQSSLENDDRSEP